ncbi:AcrR family transcriptional regulator [Skermanella stibiiresistens SB22]|uniref:AcrR family transcriptional regulator n=1 Tax=Skermanella stibiiresistens SB22 TaxID=1385369 RepID=W9H4M5_9PROT|nr:TetR/AcrR family transcriptional regulator [Skermanella stibiiresistens]EWY41175.1 AcrR family transcriptional regulator [Skermanella stibiiresistens SB22]
MNGSSDDQTSQSSPQRQRGPAEHERREQILTAANGHFRHYGYNKTTVADLAKAIGLSTAYIYKFFDSKQAIGEAVCGQCLGSIQEQLAAIADDDGKPASDRLRRIYRTIGKLSAELFFNDRKLHDIVLASMAEKWRLVDTHEAAVLEIIRRVVSAGRETGEFERKSPLDETCEAITQTLLPFWHPILLEQNLDDLDKRTTIVANLVLRGLSA